MEKFLMAVIARLKNLISERYFWKMNSLGFNAFYSLLTLILFNKIFFEKVLSGLTIWYWITNVCALP